MPPVPAKITRRQLAAAQPVVRAQGGVLSRIAGAIRAAVQPSGGGRIITTSQQLAEELRIGTRTDAGVDVSPASSMAISAVYRCVSIISGTMGMLPWRVYERDGDRETVKPEHPADILLNRSPNRWQTPFQFKQWLGVCQCLRGNGYVFVVRRGGLPVELIPLHPDRMSVEQIGDFDVRYIYTSWDGRRQIFDPSEIMHFRTVSLNGLWGLSPIEAARQGIGLAMAAEKFGARHFGQGVRPTGAVKLPEGVQLSPEQITNLRADLNTVLAGVDNSHKVAVFEAGMEWQNISMTAEEAQYIDSRKFQRSEIAMFFGVPPHMLGDVDKQTSWGSGIESQGIAFIIYTMMPWLVSSQDTVNGRLFGEGESELFTQFVTDALTRADLAAMASSIRTLTEAGTISPNEGRRMLRMNPRQDEAGDDFVVPGMNRIDSKPGAQMDDPKMKEKTDVE
ncbi:MAG: phage portal protein [Pseudomonadota bacterium]|nr:phage portal protein [Pseudomonadota bacterium]